MQRFRKLELWQNYGKNTVPNLEAKATDGSSIFKQREWLERFKQFTKREHKIDITPLMGEEDITDSKGPRKKQAIQEDFIRRVIQEALLQITRARLNPGVNRMLSTATPYLSQRGKFLLSKTIRRNTRRNLERLIEIEKEC